MHLLHQQAKLLVAAAQTPLLRLWDMTHERCVRTVACGASQGAGVCCVTSLGGEAGGGFLAPGGTVHATLVAGCTDGSMQLHDSRGVNTIAASLQAGAGPVVAAAPLCNMTGASEYELISGSSDGVIKIWDVRTSQAVKAIQVVT